MVTLCITWLPISTKCPHISYTYINAVSFYVTFCIVKNRELCYHKLTNIYRQQNWLMLIVSV